MHSERTTDVWHIAICLRNTSLSLIASTHWTVQWEFKVIILAVLDVWFWTTLLPTSPGSLFLQLWKKVDSEPCRKLPVVYWQAYDRWCKTVTWLQSVCNRPIRAVLGSNRGGVRWRNICQASHGDSLGSYALCFPTHFMSLCPSNIMLHVSWKSLAEIHFMKIWKILEQKRLY